MAGQASWYFKGKEYPVLDTHVNFILKNPKAVGLSEQEIKDIIGTDEIPKTIPEASDERVDLCIAAMKKGAIRIRNYDRGAKISIQCYDIKLNAKDLAECLMDTYYPICTVMDTKGWGEYLSEMAASYGCGKSPKDLIKELTESKNNTELYKRIFESTHSEDICIGKNK